MLPFLRKETTMLEELRKDNLLNRIHKNSNETTPMISILRQVVEQITFRYPHMKILEIGGGTGSATQSTLGHIDRSFSSYTFTDISPAFFEDAQSSFAEHSDRFIYRVLDIEKDPKQQGF